MPVIAAGSYDPTDPSDSLYDPYAGVDPFRRTPKPYNPLDPNWAYGKGGGRMPMTQGVPKSLPYGNQTPLQLPGARPSMPVGTDAATGVPGTNMTTMGRPAGAPAVGTMGDDTSAELGPYTPDEIMTPGRQPIPPFKSVGPRAPRGGPYADFTQPAGPMSGGAPAGGGNFNEQGATPPGGSRSWWDFHPEDILRRPFSPRGAPPSVDPSDFQADPSGFGQPTSPGGKMAAGGAQAILSRFGLPGLIAAGVGVPIAVELYKQFTASGGTPGTTPVPGAKAAPSEPAGTNFVRPEPPPDYHMGLIPSVVPFDHGGPAPMPPERPSDLSPAIKKVAAEAAKAAKSVPKTPGAPNMGYYAPHGRDREWVPYSKLPNGGADDPRIYRGPLQ